MDDSASIGVGSRPLGPLFPFPPAFTVLDGCAEGAGGGGRASTGRAGALPASVSICLKSLKILIKAFTSWQISLVGKDSTCLTSHSGVSF